MILTLMACSLAFAGCSNNSDNSGNTAEPTQAGQETATATASAPAASPEATPEATTEASSPEASPEAGQEPAAGAKGDYIQKLDKIEEGLADLKALSEEGTTASMSEAAGKELGRWDDALNEIYQVLKQQLPEDEMANLKEEQTKWITQRDEAAAKAAAKYEGGTMAGLEVVMVKSEITKERCYEMVEKYMK